MLILVTGSGGLIGSAAALHWLKKGADVIGIDNNMRAQFFGPKEAPAPAGTEIHRMLFHPAQLRCQSRS